MPMHKMQSGEGPPTIQLQLVPKLLAPVVNLWIPNAFVVSIKLETDENILRAKAKGALNKYKHKLVVGNMLQTRTTRAVFVTPDDNYEVALSKGQVKCGMEIEELIEADVVAKHEDFMKI